MRKVISNWVKKPQGQLLVEVVYLTEVGKNKKGKTIYSSQTKHEKR